MLITFSLSANWQDKELFQQYSFAITHKLGPESSKLTVLFTYFAENCSFLSNQWFRKEFKTLDGKPFSFTKKLGSYKEIRFYSKSEIEEEKRKQREKLRKLRENKQNSKVPVKKFGYKPPIQVTFKYIVNEQQLLISFDMEHRNSFGEIMYL